MSGKVNQRLPPLEAGIDYGKQSVVRSGSREFDMTSGPQYNLTGQDGKYTLPPPNNLKPFMDTYPGEMDTWPAHATGQTFGNLSLIRAHNTGKTGGTSRDLAPITNPWEKRVIPKPKFLDQLESFLQKELRALDCPTTGPSDLRLQVHREVFEYLINDFKTYRPLLSSIKSEYELMISALREKIREMEPLKSMLVTVSERCDQKVMEAKEQERKDLVDLRKEKIALLHKIDAMKQKHLDLEAQIDKLKEELSEEYERYKQESDQRKMLVQDLNELKSHQKEQESMSGGGSQLGGEAAEEGEDIHGGAVTDGVGEKQEDPTILKIALKNVREANAKLTAELNRMLADYADVVPRRDFEELEAVYKQYKESMKLSDQENIQRKKDQEQLLATNEEVRRERDQYFKELEELRQTSTPRPNWEVCANYLGGGGEAWTTLSEGKSSKQLVNLLLSEISGADITSFVDAIEFQCRGSGEEIPKYLRAESTVKNLYLSKAQLLKIIKEFWTQKVTSDTKRGDGKYQSMEEFFDHFLTSCYGNEAVQYAYNIVEGCQKFGFDSRLLQFKQILDNEFDEELYHWLSQIGGQLNQELMKVADGQNSVTKEQFKMCVKKQLDKTEVQLNDLTEAALLSNTDPLNNKIELEHLFKEDSEGKMTPLIGKIMEQNGKERSALVTAVERTLKDLGRPSKEVDEIIGDNLREALAYSVSDKINKESIDYAICWCFSVPSPEKATESQSTQMILERLRNSAILCHSNVTHK